MNEKTKTKIVILVGFQRNGAAMISHSFTHLPGISHLGEVFATNTKPTIELSHPNIKWKAPVYRKLFGMDRVPICMKPTLRHVQHIATPHQCNLIFDAIVAGDTQSDLNFHLNTEDRIIFGKVAFEHCPYYYQTWKYMVETEGCKIIWVDRVNPLHILISNINANTQKQWQVPLNTPKKTGPVHIDTDHLYEFIAFHTAHQTFFSLFFSRYTNVLRIPYIELATNWNDSVQKICGFLEMSESEVPLALDHQIDDHLKLIVNLKEIAAVLKNTNWEWCMNG